MISSINGNDCRNERVTLKEIDDFRTTHSSVGTLSNESLRFLIAAERSSLYSDTRINSMRGPSNAKELAMVNECLNCLANSSRAPRQL